jgi:hypothetical protein
MFKSFFEIIRNYSDALFAGFIKTAQDGRKVIYPRGVVARGYVIASEEDEERLKQAFAILIVVAPIFIGVGHVLWGLPDSVGGYFLALRHQGAIPPTEGLSPAGDSAVAEEAASYITGDVGPVRAWFMAIFGLVFSCLGIFMLVVAPESRSTGAGITAMFGLIAAFGTALIVLRHRDYQS